jgi:hypothetical protein
VSTTDLAPIDTEFVTILVSRFGLGDESDTLAEVKIDFFLRVDTSDLYQTNIVVLVTETALVTKDRSVDVKAGWSW